MTDIKANPIAAGAASAIDLICQAESRARKAEAALRGCVGIIDKAGLLNLANGVQLGQVSWYVKAVDAFDYARLVLGGSDEDASKTQKSIP